MGFSLQLGGLRNPDSARSGTFTGRSERGTPREVRRLPLQDIRRDESAASPLPSPAVSSEWTSRTSRTSPRSTAPETTRLGYPQSARGGYGGYAVASTAHLDVQRHLEVIRFTVLREHAKLRERAEQAKEQLSTLSSNFDEIVLAVDGVELKVWKDGLVW
ncbi:unnamed protein product [Effrenium voratum]|uniref:Uncharacterized protein n=1 Tax=Effrenium voratum TaxID=2562239 RepID=A0AA36JC86_9DINO|nr:unnamed protein product [Effrenium voratum]